MNEYKWYNRNMAMMVMSEGEDYGRGELFKCPYCKVEGYGFLSEHLIDCLEVEKVYGRGLNQEERLEFDHPNSKRCMEWQI